VELSFETEEQNNCIEKNAQKEDPFNCSKFAKHLKVNV
jgi:hypothetical protein